MHRCDAVDDLSSATVSAGRARCSMAEAGHLGHLGEGEQKLARIGAPEYLDVAFHPVSHHTCRDDLARQVAYGSNSLALGFLGTTGPASSRSGKRNLSHC